jgi:hypothetical protein
VGESPDDDDPDCLAFPQGQWADEEGRRGMEEHGEVSVGVRLAPRVHDLERLAGLAVSS